MTTLFPLYKISPDRIGALKTLRKYLRTISASCPGRWFKSDLIAGGVMIRMCEKQHRFEVVIALTRQSDSFLAAVDRPDFRERLIDELIYQGFPIDREGKGITA